MSEPESKKIEVGTCKTLDISEIKASKFNAREQKEAMDSDDFVELCDSIRVNGLIEPIIVRKSPDNSHYEAIAGSRRLRAMKHVGIKVAPVVLRKMDDNDVRIASLVENIHRKGLEFEEKRKTLVDIYKAEGYKDIAEVIKYLYRIHYSSQRGGQNFKSRIPMPPEFTEFANRIGYSAVRQANILKGFTDERRAIDRNYIAELEPEKRQMIETEPILKKNPVIQQEVARQAKKLLPRRASKVIKQVIHDIKTGAMEEDEEGAVTYHSSKHENISKLPQTELNPVRAREEIIQTSEKLFKLITGMKLDMGDVHRAEKQADSKQARDNIHEICTYNLTIREKRSLQDATLPLQKALNRLQDEIES
jgi:hypothetical protein